MRWPLIGLYRVEGSSMLPALNPGDVLLGSALIRPRVGHVVVAQVSPLSIKRIKRVTDEGIWIEGDNAGMSTDSRSYGYIDRKDVRAVIFMKLY